MSYIDFQKLKEQVDIISACSFLGLELKDKGNQLRGPCPTCKSNERSLVITPSKGLFYCFQAKQGGDVIALTAHIRDIGNKEAARLLSEQYGTVPEEKRSVQVPKEKGIAPLSYLRADHESVVSLGVTQETAEHFEAGHAPKGIMRGKLAIPVHDRHGTLLAYCGRTYEPANKALTLPNGFKAEEHIFNAHRVTDGELYLTRDPLEVLLAFENGVENVVSFLTETIFPIQLEMLASLMDEKGCYSVEIIE